MSFRVEIAKETKRAVKRHCEGCKVSKHVTKSPEVDVFTSRVLVKNEESCDLQLVSQLDYLCKSFEEAVNTFFNKTIQKVLFCTVSCVVFLPNCVIIGILGCNQ